MPDGGHVTTPLELSSLLVRRAKVREAVPPASGTAATGLPLLARVGNRSGVRTEMIAALYVQTGGAYFGLEDVDPWDETRDARLYAGPWAVVAHPPCQRWCRFAKEIETQYGYRVGDDGGCFAAALAAVRRFGGVLEHPAGSLAWDAYNLPKPKSSAGWTSDLFDPAGASCYVEQGRYGHRARKATWLYAYGIDLPTLRWGRRIDSEGGAFKWGHYAYKPEANRNRPRLKESELAVTLPAFRDALLDMARTAPPSFDVLPALA
jgi:hypothetical protein